MSVPFGHNACTSNIEQNLVQSVVMNHRHCWGEGNLRPRRPPHKYLGEYTSREKPQIVPADRKKASKNPSNNADLGFQAIGIRLIRRIMQLNVEGLSAAKRRIICFTHMRRRLNLLHFHYRQICHEKQLIVTQRLSNKKPS